MKAAVDEPPQFAPCGEALLRFRAIHTAATSHIIRNQNPHLQYSIQLTSCFSFFFVLLLSIIVIIISILCQLFFSDKSRRAQAPEDHEAQQEETARRHMTPATCLVDIPVLGISLVSRVRLI